jgi:DNA topoisomerase-3
VWAVDGDGCFQMTAQELVTASSERIPIKVAILNNAYLGMVRQWQEMFYDERFGQTHLTHAVPNYAQLAEAYGCAGFTVETEEELKAKQSEEDSEGEGTEIPPLEQGQTVRCVAAESEAKETKPPPRYTEATLLSAMETAGKLIDDEELREAMKDSGLGTPATRAETIETLIRREYIERAGRDLQATPKGIQVITMLEEHKLTSPELTGDWEKRLSDIEHGSGDREAFMREIVGFAKETVEQIAALDKEKLRPERVELGQCPRCGAVTGEIIRENSRAYGCTSWKSREEPGCGFVIWKRVAGRTITPEVARQLMEEGRTKEVLSGFRSRSGKPFRARLVFTQDGKVEFDFPPRGQASEQQAEQTAEPAAAE